MKHTQIEAHLRGPIRLKLWENCPIGWDLYRTLGRKLDNALDERVRVALLCKVDFHE
jgi:hypothetical protein